MSQVCIPPLSWKARDYQHNLWNYRQRGGTRAICIWPRRHGKDEVAMRITSKEMILNPANYWHMLPEAAQARKAIWNSINPKTGIRRIDEAFPKEIRSKTIDDEMLIKCHGGATWQVVGSDNYNNLIGSSPKGVVFSEWATANPLAWAYIRPILQENNGWAIFITTPRGYNHCYDMLTAAKNDPTWFSEVLTSNDTGVFTHEQLEKERISYIAEFGPDVGNALFRQEYMCSFDAAVLGSVYGEWIERLEQQKRVRPNIFDPELEVWTAWDLGYDDSTVILFYQRTKNEIRFIDVYAANQQDIKHYCDVLRQKGYKYAPAHLVPHDAGIKTLQAGGRSIVQQAHELGVKMKVIPASSQANQIAAGRKILEQCWFDADKCFKLVMALKNYRFKYDQTLKVFSKEPVHDDNSHYADAFEIVGLTNARSDNNIQKEEPRFLHNMTANDLFWPKDQPNLGKNYRI